MGRKREHLPVARKKGVSAGMGNQLDGARGACGRSLDHLTSFVLRPTVDTVRRCTCILLAVNRKCYDDVQLFARLPH